MCCHSGWSTTEFGISWPEEEEEGLRPFVCHVKTFLEDIDMIVYVHMCTLVVIFAFFCKCTMLMKGVLKYTVFVCLAFVCRAVFTTMN